MPKCGGKLIFSHGSFPEVGEKQKAYKKKKKKKVGENNGQLRFRPPPRVAHASRLDQLKRKVAYTQKDLMMSLSLLIMLLVLFIFSYFLARVFIYLAYHKIMDEMEYEYSRD